MDVNNRGYIWRRDLIEKTRQLDVSQHYREILENICLRKTVNDPLDFEDFCHLIVKWREISPSSFELLYNSWVHRVGADFTGECEVFPDICGTEKPNGLGNRPQASHEAIISTDVSFVELFVFVFVM